MKRVLLSWSSGKDSAWALHVLRQDPDVEVVGLLTTFNEAVDRVAMHAVRHAVVDAQAAAAGLPVMPVYIPAPCPNEVYEARMRDAMASARGCGITHVAFGDLFLADVRQYRESRMAGTGIAPLFPLWRTAAETPALADAMVAAGMRAIITCVDPRRLDPAYAGRVWGRGVVESLREENARRRQTGEAPVDLCAEHGEFHTCVTHGPMFRGSLALERGIVLERDGFVFCDVSLSANGAPSPRS